MSIQIAEGPAEQLTLSAQERFAELTADAVIRHLFAIGMHAASAQAIDPQPEVREKLEQLISEADTALRVLRAGLIEMAAEPNPSHAHNEGAMSGKRLRTKVVPDGDKRHIVRLSGELDRATGDDAHAYLVGIAGSTIVVDLAELTFLDSAGVMALVTAKEIVDHNGRRLELRGGQRRQIRRVFELCGFDQLLDT